MVGGRANALGGEERGRGLEGRGQYLVGRKVGLGGIAGGINGHIGVGVDFGGGVQSWPSGIRSRFIHASYCHVGALFARCSFAIVQRMGVFRSGLIPID